MSHALTREQTGETEVLVAESNRKLAAVFATWLAERHAVETVHSGADALDALGPNTDVVLVDCQFTGISGRALLRRMRERESNYQVAVISAVEPDERIIDLDIDEYVRKPVSSTELSNLVERLAQRQSLDADLQAYLSLASKKQALEDERSIDWLASNSRYQRLLVELAERRDVLSGSGETQFDLRERSSPEGVESESVPY